MDTSPPYPIVTQAKLNKQIHISNLQPGMGKEQLHTLFSAYGKLDFIYTYTDITGNDCAYITFKTKFDLMNAFRGINTMVSDVKLTIHFTNFYPPRLPPLKNNSVLIDGDNSNDSIYE